jgi:hypothetical protein
MALPARHGQRADAVLAHVAEGHRLDGSLERVRAIGVT